MLQHDQLFIDGQWRKPAAEAVSQVYNPASGEVIGHVPLARKSVV